MRELAREGVKVGEHLRVGHVRRVALRHKDEIHAGRELTAAMPKNFTHAPLNRVAPDGIPHLLGHSDPETLGHFVLLHTRASRREDHKKSDVGLRATSLDAQKVPALFQSPTGAVQAPEVTCHPWTPSVACDLDGVGPR